MRFSSPVPPASPGGIYRFRKALSDIFSILYDFLLFR